MTLSPSRKVASNVGEPSPLRVLIDDAFERAERIGVGYDRLRFGPMTVDLGFHGPDLRRRLMPALEHGAGAGRTAPTLHLLALDTAAGGLPSVPEWRLPHSDPRQTEWHMAREGDLCFQFIPEFRVLSAFDVQSRRGLFWCENAAELPFWDVGAPFKTLLHWASASTDCAVLHSGALTDGRRGALLMGAGGSGKSTTVAACLEAGLGTVGDDLVLVQQANGSGSPMAHALFDGVKLDAWALRSLETMADLPAIPAGEKRLCRFAGGRLADRFVSSQSIDVLLLPRVTGEAATTFSPVSAAEALRALVPATVFLLRGFGEHTIAKASALTRALPAYRVQLGRDPREAAATLGAWLSGLP